MSLPEMTLDQDPPIVTSEGEVIGTQADPEPAALALPPVRQETPPAPQQEVKGRRRVTPVSVEGEGSRASGRKPRHGRRGQPDEDEWTEFFSKYALEWLMSAYIWLCFRGVNWSLLDEEFRDSLYADEEDVATIAEALASFTHGTSFSRRYGRKVVNSAALLDAGHALLMWGIQVQKAAARVKKQQGVTTPPLISRKPKHEKTERNVSRSTAETSPREGNGQSPASTEPERIPIRIVNPGGA
jgi:hypothetical protein